MSRLSYCERRHGTGGGFTPAIELLEKRQLLASAGVAAMIGPSLPAPVHADLVPGKDPAASRLATAEASGATRALEVAGDTSRLVENLDRGVVAINKGGGQVYVGWRMLGLDPAEIGFNLYRSTNGGEPIRLNASPLTQTTDFLDVGVDTSQSNRYTVRPVVGGVEGETGGSFTLPAGAAARPYLSVPIQPPANTTLDGETVTYSANDTSVGDLDGDGDYELIVKWDPSNSGDNNAGFRSNVYIDAYTLEGQQLWRIDLGRNIRAGAHYTQFQVYDLDGDGRAEVAMRTAPGTIDGQGNAVVLPGDDPNADYRNGSGYILSGPEYLTVFDGLTGGELASVPFEPHRGHVSEWGDNYGNRVDRHTAGVAYLDGHRPSLVFGRGYYGPISSSFDARNEVAAYDWRDGELTLRWIFKAHTDGPNAEFIGQGAHSITIGDVDGDGFDEVVYGAAVIDHDGTGLYSTGLGHGDALHMSDMDPSRPGQEIFMVHESPSAYQSDGRDAGGSLRDAATGELLVQIPSHNDVGRGVAFDIDPNYPGYEMWGTTNEGTRMVYNVSGEAIYPTPSNMHYNFGVWWDADPLRETLDGTIVSKWRYDWENPGRRNILEAWRQGATANNGTKNTPALSGDILGDWREEIIWRNGDSTELQVWTTTTQANSRMYTLMHDTQYRAAIAWQNSGYNQPPHPSFFLGAGMADPPTPDIQYVSSDAFRPDRGSLDIYQAEDAQVGGGAFFEDSNAGWNGTGYLNFNSDGGYVEFTNVDGGMGGSTDVRVRHALGPSPNPDRDGLLIVNGVPQPIHFDNTGSWTSWMLGHYQLDLLPGATNTIRFEATGDDLANIDELQVRPRLLPEPWETGDFGRGPGGAASWNNDVFTVTGAGADIWGQSDAFRFVYQPLTGDGQIIAQVDGPDGSGMDPWAKAGLMIRGSLEADAANGAILLTGDRGAAFQQRLADGEATASSITPDITGPYWLRIARAGDAVTGFISADGQDWSALGTWEIDLPETAYVGMAVTSHNADAQVTATFSDVNISDLPAVAKLEEILVNGGAAQRSMVRDLTLQFDAPVSLLDGAYSLSRQGGESIPLAAGNPTGDRMTWVLTPSGSGVTAGSLNDGIYDLVINQSLIVDELNRSAGVETQRLTFHRLFGDFDGNKRVDFFDFLKFRAAYGSVSTDPQFDDAADGDDNGAVNFFDFLRFRQNYGTGLTY